MTTLDILDLDGIVAKIGCPRDSLAEARLWDQSDWTTHAQHDHAHRWIVTMHSSTISSIDGSGGHIIGIGMDAANKRNGNYLLISDFITDSQRTAIYESAVSVLGGHMCLATVLELRAFAAGWLAHS